LLQSDNPTSDTLEYRKKSVINGIGGELHEVLLAIHENRPRQNQGNRRARGYTYAKLDQKQRQFEAMTALPPGTPMWIYNTNMAGDPLPPPQLLQGHPVFDEWTYMGLQGRLSGKSAKKNNRNNTNRPKERPLDIPMVIRKCSCYAGVDGQKSLVLIKLLQVDVEDVDVEDDEDVEEEDEATAAVSRPARPSVAAVPAATVAPAAVVAARKNRQMKAVQDLAIGTRFWTRVDSQTLPNDPNRPNDGRYECYNEIAFIGVRDSFKKDQPQIKSVKKVMQTAKGKGNRPVLSKCRKWVLAEIVAFDSAAAIHQYRRHNHRR
jgi:hypothetical protein